MDDLSRARDTITRCCATLLDASYTDGIPTETTDVWRTIAADAADAEKAIVTRLRAAEARIERVGAILGDEGCDCYCDCDSHHNADCDLCLGCRIDREVSRG